jgi:aminoglycoside/choline kinase family phosphotransferase
VRPVHEALRRLFRARFGDEPEAATMASDGSRRRMTRLAGGGVTAVGVEGPDLDENRAFLSFSRSFREAGLPVPEVYGDDLAAGCYLVEDLGDTTLFRALVKARSEAGGAFPPAILPAYERVVEELPRFQVVGGRVADFRVASPRAAFDRRSMLWDLNYFKYHFLKLAHVPFHEDHLERDFRRLADVLAKADATHFLYRDFQSRNVMLRGGEPWFLDYQGGRRGALAYDVASLLYDAKAEIPPSVREALLGRYLDALSEHVAVDRDRFRAEYPGFVLVRILQAMGAYGYRGFYERKPHFLASVPPAVENLRAVLAEGALPADLPELRVVLARVAADARFARTTPPPPRGLTVHVGSFRYARGAPEDPGGHGGGFVFDCRALENPGRLDALAGLTGLDPDVARALEGAPATEEFYASARSLVAAQVRAYAARGFESLQVLFGCTGGRHRSVYFAERLAKDLGAAFPAVRFPVTHAEQERWDSPPAALPRRTAVPA